MKSRCRRIADTSEDHIRGMSKDKDCAMRIWSSLLIAAPVAVGLLAAPAAHADWHHNGDWHGHGGGWHGGGGDWHHNNNGANVAAGVVGGLAVGAIIGGVIASQQQPYYAPPPAVVYAPPPPYYSYGSQY